MFRKLPDLTRGSGHDPLKSPGFFLCHSGRGEGSQLVVLGFAPTSKLLPRGTLDPPCVSCGGADSQMCGGTSSYVRGCRLLLGRRALSSFGERRRLVFLSRSSCSRYGSQKPHVHQWKFDLRLRHDRVFVFVGIEHSTSVPRDRCLYVRGRSGVKQGLSMPR